MRVIFLSVILIGVAFNSFATYTARGCVSTYTGYLYTGFSGALSPNGSPNSGERAYETTPVVNSGLGTGDYCNPVYLGQCVIRTTTQCAGCTEDRFRYSNGTRYYEQPGHEYGYFECPVDDYVGLLLAAMGAVGFFVVRKMQLV